MKLLKLMIIMVIMMMGVALGDIVDETCKQTSYYTFCVSLLRSDPRSFSSANSVGLAEVLLDKIKTFGIYTRGQIKKAYKTKPLLKPHLDDCNYAYKAIVEDHIDEAYQAFLGNPKFTEDGIANSKIEVSGCEGGFPKGQSPLTALNERMNKICDVARAIIKMSL